MERARMLFGCYRRGEANDPETYVAAVSAVLSLYDADLIREVTDPRTGIQTTQKHMSFMPNPGEIKVYCEAVASRRDRLKHLGSLPPLAPPRALLTRPEPRPGDLANVWVPASNPKYDRILRWSQSGTADPRLWRTEQGKHGIWVAWNIAEAPHTLATKPASTEPAEPKPLQLSEAALRVMNEIDAERGHTTAADQPEDYGHERAGTG